jgi:hypothetical protein
VSKHTKTKEEKKAGAAHASRATATPIQVPPSSDEPKPRRSLLGLASAIIGVLAAVAGIVAGTGYAIEKWHETLAVVDMGEVDQQKPFSAPVQIKNPSAIFDMHSPSITCRFSAEYTNGVFLPEGGTVGRHGIPKITAGESGVFFCDMPDKFTITDNATGKINTLISATMVIIVNYETWVPWSVSQQTPPTTFTLLNTSNGYRWVKGALIK